SVTCRTASILNSSVYRLLLMDTSESAIFHGLEMSRKSWAYQTVNATAALGLDFYCRQRTAELHPQLPVFGALLSAHGLLPKL
ncbi:hypothetical protein AB5N79_23820, partial [Xanthomonas citri pv. citri]